MCLPNFLTLTYTKDELMHNKVGAERAVFLIPRLFALSFSPLLYRPSCFQMGTIPCMSFSPVLCTFVSEALRVNLLLVKGRNPDLRDTDAFDLREVELNGHWKALSIRSPGL